MNRPLVTLRGFRPLRGLDTFCNIDLGLAPQAGDPQPSISAGVEVFMLTSASRTGHLAEAEVLMINSRSSIK